MASVYLTANKPTAVTRLRFSGAVKPETALRTYEDGDDEEEEEEAPPKDSCPSCWALMRLFGISCRG